MTTFLLIRHGLTAAVGHRITGRLPGVPLNETGVRQANGLPQRIKAGPWLPLQAIYSSPLQRALETSKPVGAAFGLEVTLDEAFSEFDFGHWSGLLISELDGRPDWQRFCRYRSSVRAPGGELITEVQTRVVSRLETLRERHTGQTVAIFSHADAIKTALMHYLAMPLDNIHRLDVEPASINVLRLDEWSPMVAGVNLCK